MTSVGDSNHMSALTDLSKRSAADDVSSTSLLHKTHSRWILWYHNPLDKKWDLSSYTKIMEFDTIESFWSLYTSWDSILPKVHDGMFFLMRRLKNGQYIYPLWEDKYNKRGGFWSFKITKDESHDIWEKLSVYLVGEQMGRDADNPMLFNGISVSPKKNFCIVKIWNSDYTQKSHDLLSNKMDFLNLNEVMYKCHNDNIANDQIKIKRSHQRTMGKHGGRRSRHHHSGAS